MPLTARGFIQVIRSSRSRPIISSGSEPAAVSIALRSLMSVNVASTSAPSAPLLEAPELRLRPPARAVRADQAELDTGRATRP